MTETSDKKKILIIEDERPIAHALELKLKSEGFDVHVVYDGVEGVRELSENSYSLALLDIMMPKKNGFEVLKDLQEKGNTIPIIVSTNLGQKEDIEKAKQLGAFDFFVKSNTPLTQVIDKIKNVLKS